MSILLGMNDGSYTDFNQEKLKATMEEIEPKIQELEALAAEYEAKIYAAAKPVPRKYEIVRVEE